ncbi:MAG TPA: hypothetical protein VFZ58_00695 [Candidatus Saccharimonadales bacterium]
MSYNTLPPEPPLPEQVPQLYTGERLSDEAIDTINQYYDIEVYVGRHGTGRASQQYYNPSSMPTQAEYAATEAVAGSLRPGDMFFIEGKGFSAQTEQYGFTVQQARSLANDYHTDTFTHAHLMAEAQGFAVSRADLNSSEWQQVEAALGKPVENLKLDDPIEVAKFKAVDVQRERAAARKVVDSALFQASGLIEPQQKSGLEEEKRRLVLLFGTDHKEGLVEAFNELGLAVTVGELHRSTPEERTSEHLRYAAVLAIQSMLDQLPEPGSDNK